MTDITYSLETLTGKHGGLLEVVEAIVSDGRLIMILTDEDVLQKRDAPLKGIFYRVVLPLAPAKMKVKGEAFANWSGKVSNFRRMAEVWRNLSVR